MALPLTSRMRPSWIPSPPGSGTSNSAISGIHSVETGKRLNERFFNGCRVSQSYFYMHISRSTLWMLRETVRYTLLLASNFFAKGSRSLAISLPEVLGPTIKTVCKSISTEMRWYRDGRDWARTLFVYLSGVRYTLEWCTLHLSASPTAFWVDHSTSPFISGTWGESYGPDAITTASKSSRHQVTFSLSFVWPDSRAKTFSSFFNVIVHVPFDFSSHSTRVLYDATPASSLTLSRWIEAYARTWAWIVCAEMTQGCDVVHSNC